MNNDREEASANNEGQTDAQPIDDGLLCDAEIIEQHLRFFRSRMRRLIEHEKSRTTLTTPQLLTMQILSRPAHEQGLSLKELSQHMGLAHSTVSGIVDRLERRRMVCRVVDSADRRLTRIAVTNPVRTYVQQEFPALYLQPLIGALQQASEDERKTILEGLALLHRLLSISNEQVEL